MVKLLDNYLEKSERFAEAKINIPKFDQGKVAESTTDNPVWVHFGGGNLFRCFHAVVAQDLLNQGELNSGIIVAETYDDEVIEKGVQNVKRILSDNFVRPDESQKVLSLLRERGSFTVIDRLTVKLNIKYDRYEADFSNLGIKNIPIAAEYVSQYDRLLCGGIWCIVQLDY